MAFWEKTHNAQVVRTMTPWGMVDHLRLSRYDGKSVVLAWDILQAIKDRYLGYDVTAIEIFPASNELVSEVNMRHFWAVPDGTSIPSLRR